MSTFTIHVEDMHCANCVNKIQQALAPCADQDQLRINPVRRQVLVSSDSGLHPAELLEKIRRAGFHPRLTGNTQGHSDQQLLRRLGVAGIAMMQVMMIHIALYAGVFGGIEPVYERLLQFTALIFCIPVVCYSAVPFFHRALQLRGGMNMDVPIALAITIAFTVSVSHTLQGPTLHGGGDVYYDSVVMFTFLMLAARYIDQRLRDRLTVEDDLLSSLPGKANLYQPDGSPPRTISVEALQAGDLLWIAEGEQLVGDGILQSAGATLDEALLTGEAQWRTRSRGATLYAGTHNRGPGFILQIVNPAASSRLAQLDNFARQAQFQKLHVTRIADRVAQIFVPTILAIAALTYAVWTWIDSTAALSAALAVLVVSCPCALSLATPAAISAGLARLRQAGLLVRNAAALEVAGDTRTVYFDKTGTLTEARPRIQATHAKSPRSADECLKYAASLQVHSTHPLAQAFHHLQHWDATDVVIDAGRGISGLVQGHVVRIGTPDHVGAPAIARGNGSWDATAHQGQPGGKEVFMSIDGILAAAFELSSQIRPEARATINWLQNADIRSHMLSGDTPEQCAPLASTLAIDFTAGASPEAKADLLRQLQQKHSLYVGDGLNDLPVLAAATVSVATLETSDLVKAKADAILIAPGLTPIADLIHISRRTRQIIRQNLRWAFAYNLVAIPLAALGYAPPWLAALGMSASSLIVLGNAARLLRTPIQLEKQPGAT